MDSIEKALSQPVKNTGDKPGNIVEVSPVNPMDEGVAIPPAQPPLPAPSAKSNDNNHPDIQANKNQPPKNEREKKVKVRTFSDSLWYVALVRTKCEQKTADVMDKFDDAHRVNTWLPRQRIGDGDGMGAYRLDILGYVFFHLPKQDERNLKTRYETLRNIRSISYVRGLLTNPMTGEPARIPNFQIERLKVMLNDALHPTTLTTSMVHQGTRVKVVRGTLKGAEGTVKDIRQKESAIYITLDYLGCAKTVIKTSQVVPIVDEQEGEQEDKPQKGRPVKVSTAEWLTLHNYREATSDDTLYVNFANELLHVLDDSRLGIPLAKRKPLALSLASYVEDKRTRFGLFAFFVTIQKDLAHPLQAFFPEASDAAKIRDYMARDYDPGNVNLVDLMYFLRASDNGKMHSLNSVKIKADLLLAAIENLGGAQLPSNHFYASNVSNLIQDGSLKGLKRLLSWIARRISYFSCGTIPMPAPRHIFCPYPRTSGAGPLTLALQLSIRLKARIALTRKIEAMLRAPLSVYEVSGCYRKAVRLIDSDHKKHTVYFDEISGTAFAPGEHYACKLIETDTGKWCMVEPPVKQ